MISHSFTPPLFFSKAPHSNLSFVFPSKLRILFFPFFTTEGNVHKILVLFGVGFVASCQCD